MNVGSPQAWYFEARHVDSDWRPAVSLQHPGAEGVYLRNVTRLIPQPAARGGGVMGQKEQFEAWCAANGHGTNDDLMMPLDRSLKALLWTAYQAGHAAARAEAVELLRDARVYVDDFVDRLQCRNKGKKLPADLPSVVLLARIDAYIKGDTNG
jgi:hypothetical protein